MPTPAAAPSPAPHHSIAFAVWAALSFSVPQMLLSLMIYPEVIAGLALVYAFRQVAIRPLPSQLWRRSLVGLAIAVLPWLNPRFVLLSGVLTLLAVIVLWRSALLASKQSPPLSAGARNDVLTSIGLLLGPAAISMMALRWYQLQIHGSSLGVADQYEGFFVPSLADGRVGADWQALSVAMAGLFVDRQYGLLVFTPVYALAIVGQVALWRSPSYRWAAASLAVIVVPYVLLTADFRVWWGGWSPPARYLAVLTPLMAAPLAQALLASSGVRSYHMLFAVLAGLGMLAVAAFLLQLGDPEIEQAIFSNPSRNPMMLHWLRLRFGVDLSSLLPSVAPWFGDQQAPVPWPQIAGSIALLGLTIGFAMRAIPRHPEQPALQHRPRSHAAVV